uniref:Uncharacterized protein n=1 Tax=Arundo donax TaxID=35708 RepID=A0A0A9BAB4_ARUDO
MNETELNLKHRVKYANPKQEMKIKGKDINRGADLQMYQERWGKQGRAHGEDCRRWARRRR